MRRRSGLVAVALVGGVVAAVPSVGVAPTPPTPAPTSSGTVASRADLAHHRLFDAHGRRLDGRGTTIAVIDTGVDPAHPAFALPGGRTKIVRTLSALPCLRYGEDSPFTQSLSDDPS